MKILLLVLCVMFGFSSVCIARTILHYEPAIVQLTGVIEQQTFPGLPNYESIANGDEIEKGWYLRLSHPVDVLESNNDAPSACSETERNVKIMHITFDNKLKKEIRRTTKLKKAVRLTGYLFHRLSGHNHSRVLMFVKHIGRN